MAKMIQMPENIKKPSNEQKWEYANFTDKFVFAYILRNHKDITKEILARIIPEMKNEDFNVEHEVRNGENGKFKENVLDIRITFSNGTLIAFDMQNDWEECICGRIRIYGSNIDSFLLLKGAESYCVPNVIVIFLCRFDPGKKRKYVYDSRPRGEQLPDGWLNTGMRHICLNAKGMKGPVSPKLKAFLDYVNGIEADDDLCDNIDRAVQKMKDDENLRRNYMSYSMYMEDQRRAAENKGLKRGREEGRREGESIKEKSLILQNMKDGVPLEQIAKFMHMPLEDVGKIAEKEGSVT